MVTPIIVMSIVVASIVVIPTSLRIVNRSGRSFALGVRSEGNVLGAHCVVFRLQRWQ